LKRTGISVYNRRHPLLGGRVTVVACCEVLGKASAAQAVDLNGVGVGFDRAKENRQPASSRGLTLS
jgi:hypothetical protein